MRRPTASGGNDNIAVVLVKPLESGGEHMSLSILEHILQNRYEILERHRVRRHV